MMNMGSMRTSWMRMTWGLERISDPSPSLLLVGSLRAVDAPPPPSVASHVVEREMAAEGQVAGGASRATQHADRRRLSVVSSEHPGRRLRLS